MHIRVTFSNYRCFSKTAPAVLELRDGITAVLGTNNSGKSALLRAFFEMRPTFGGDAALRIVQAAFNGSNYPIQLHESVRDRAELIHTRIREPLRVRIERLDCPTHDKETLNVRAVEVSTDAHGAGVPELPDLQLRSRGLVQASNAGGITQSGERLSFQPIQQALDALRESVYIGPFRHAMPTNQDAYFDIETGSRVASRWDQIRNGDSLRERNHCDLLLGELASLLNFDRLDIRIGTARRELLISADGNTLPLGSVGAGIGQFIVLFVNLAYKNPAFIFIDEPELHLHAAKQIELIDALQRKTKHGVVFATHSAGLARSTAQDICVLKYKSGVSTLHRVDGSVSLGTMASELGYRMYDQVGADRILLVEGVTDAPVFRTILRRMRLDDRVVVLNLWGSNGISAKSEAELQELLRFTRVGAIIDRDTDSGSAPLRRDRQQFVDLCKRCTPEVPCHVLSRRAIENYFSEHAIKAAVSDAAKGLSEFEKLQPEVHGWAKSSNAAIAAVQDWGESSEIPQAIRRILALDASG